MTTALPVRHNLGSRIRVGASALFLSLAAFSTAAPAKEVLKFYNWSDYIAEDTIERFEKETGIDVIADVFDSNEVLEAKMLAGSSGYDLVVPSSSFLGRQIIAGVFQPLDKSKLPNLRHLDPKLMKVLQRVDPENRYGVPYLWGTTGIGYNVEKVRAILGDNAPVDSWDLVFNPTNLEKLSQCGVTFLDAPVELVPLALNYLGLDPNSKNPSDYKRNGSPAKVLKGVRPFVTQFHSSQYINDLANGDICVAIGWSGDVIQAATRAQEVNNGVEIAYSIPREGTSVWFDVLAIPAGAENAENAHRFIDFLMRPDVIADITNYVAYANANTASRAMLDAEIASDPGIYPSDDVMNRLFPQEVIPKKIDRLLTRMWTDVKTGR